MRARTRRYAYSYDEYLTLEADAPARSRDEAGNWSSREFRAGDRATLAAVGCSLDVDIIYGEARKNVPPEPA
jgi:hypothetical protein